MKQLIQNNSKIQRENHLTPVKLSGVILPWLKTLEPNQVSHFKLVGSSGCEYFFVPDPEWKKVLQQYQWKEVKVIGLYNIANRSLIPQKIYPVGPTEEFIPIAEAENEQRRNLVKKWVRNLNDWVVVPVAVWALMAS